MVYSVKYEKFSGIIVVEITQTAKVTNAQARETDAQLRKVAVEFEASFLAEMLKAAGLGKQSSGFGGGHGEDQFASFLVQEQAKAMAETGGVGLAESIFESLKERQNGNL